MAGIKKSIRLVDETIDLCRILSVREDVSYSSAINGMAQRYNILIDNINLSLSEGEVMVICAAFNGYMMDVNIYNEILNFEWHISESILYDENVQEILSHFKIEVEAFKDKIAVWSDTEKLAAIDMTQRYWNK